MSTVWRVALPVPVATLFDYLPSPEIPDSVIEPGVRLRVPFSHRERIGVLVEIATGTRLGRDRLRAASAVIDPKPLLNGQDLELLCWAARYYHHPIGEVIAAALPGSLRRGRAAGSPSKAILALTADGRLAALDTLSRAPRQAQLLASLQATANGQLDPVSLDTRQSGWRAAARSLIKKQLACFRPAGEDIAPGHLSSAGVNHSAPSVSGFELNPAQAAAVQAVAQGLGSHTTVLLDGVTGSGKTEVYLELARRAIARGEQILVLLPEISLTPQLERRFRENLSVAVSVFHSSLSETQRLASWRDIQLGRTPVLLGTRSAAFLPMHRPGLIVVDEEHDPSFKQQEGFRFSARDVAIKRGQLQRIPVLLGSATPCLESLSNARSGRYQHLFLPERASGASKPAIRLIDIRQQRLKDGLSRPLIEDMHAALENGHQVLLFLNRRGFAPTLICHDCGWVAPCPHCDARLVVHLGQLSLRCHHCNHQLVLPSACPSCGSTELQPLGLGTERIETDLAVRFPGARIIRIDRDTTQGSGRLKQALSSIQDGKVDILIGTQMLAKGHHFPAVTLVGILDADAMLFATDFRASERTAQLIVQVAGRAGRSTHPGRVLLQTRNPEHPLLRTLVRGGYSEFAELALAERRGAGLPPYGHLAVLRADAQDAQTPLGFLEALRDTLLANNTGRVEILGPAPAPMLRQAGRHRYQLLLRCETRRPLHRLLEDLGQELGRIEHFRSVRWSLDIDPVDCY